MEHKNDFYVLTNEFSNSNILMVFLAIIGDFVNDLLWVYKTRFEMFENLILLKC